MLRPRGHDRAEKVIDAIVSRAQRDDFAHGYALVHSTSLFRFGSAFETAETRLRDVALSNSSLAP
jgi:hypothetical protein